MKLTPISIVQAVVSFVALRGLPDRNFGLTQNFEGEGFLDLATELRDVVARLNRTFAVVDRRPDFFAGSL